MSKFSERFRLLKDKSEMTLKELSTALDISVPNLSYYMKGREPSYDILIRIADYFDVTIDWLVGRTDARNPIASDILSEVENRLGIIPQNKLSNTRLEKYFSIQNILIDILDKVYFLFLHLNDDFPQDFYNKFEMIFLTLNIEIESYIKPLVDANKEINTMLKFTNDINLISETLRIIILFCSYSYADYMAKYCPESSVNNSSTIENYINYIHKQFSTIYPDIKVQEMFDYVRNL